MADDDLRALTPPRLPQGALVLVNPGVPIATAEVFKKRAAVFSKPAELPSAWPDAAAMADALRLLRNDLEPPARMLCPVVADVLEALRGEPGCLLARMSGSGATCFGLFERQAEAETAALNLGRRGWWTRAGAVGR